MTNSNWMERIFDQNQRENTSLNQIFIPGTHDSGTYNIDIRNIELAEAEINEEDSKRKIKEIRELIQKINFLKPIPIIGKFNGLNFISTTFSNAFDAFIVGGAKAQEKTIKEQLNDGIRFFDLRPCVRHGEKGFEFWISHSLYSVKLDDVLQDIRHFLDINQKEIVILDCRYLWGFKDKEHKDEYSEALYNQICDRLSKERLIEKSIFEPNKMPTVGEIWKGKGRVLLLWNVDDHGSGAKGSFVKEKNIMNSWTWPTTLGDDLDKPTWQCKIETINSQICNNKNDFNSPNKFRIIKCEITPEVDKLVDEVKDDLKEIFNILLSIPSSFIRIISIINRIKSLIKSLTKYPEKFKQFSLRTFAGSNKKMITPIKEEWNKEGCVFTFDHYDNCEVVNVIIELNEKPSFLTDSPIGIAVTTS